MNGIKLSQEEALERVNDACGRANLQFIGFDTEDGLYKNNNTKVRVKCNVCGTEYSYNFHKLTKENRKCKKCSGHYQYTKDEMVEKIKARCEELDYEFLGFVSENVGNTVKRTEKIILRCNKCGYEWDTSTINNFFKTDRTSHTCGRQNPEFRSSTKRITESDITKLIEDKLTGSKLKLIKVNNDLTHVTLRCSECGYEDSYKVDGIKYKDGVPTCKKCEFNGRVSNDDAIKAIQDKCEALGYEFIGFKTKDGRYNGKDTKLILKCKKCGYTWNTSSFITFTHSVIKCRGCTNSWKMEKEVGYYLREAGIDFEEQKKFDWLRYKSPLSLDFYLPKYDIAIECQGRQHYEPVPSFGGEKDFLDTKERDKAKLKSCDEHGIKVVYYSASRIAKNIDIVARNKEELMNKIWTLITRESMEKESMS